jgi:glycosyltransferase involved in cell wall biosynthesis
MPRFTMVDGGSSDRSLEIAREAIKPLGERARLLVGSDSGIYDGMNRGLKEARGDYIGILNCDDWYEDGALQIVEDCARARNADVVYGLLREFENDTLVRLSCNSHQALHMQMIPHPACFIARRVYDRFGLYSTKYRLASDYEFLLRIRNDVTFELVEKVLTNFQLGGATRSVLSTIETLRVRRTYGCIGSARYLFGVLFQSMKRLVNG